jgi:hypothetical protein
VTAAVLGLLLAWPTAGAGSHITGVTASVTARTVERFSADTWIVEVRWQATCVGATGNTSWGGTLNLVDVRTGETIFLGGVNSGSGTQRQLIHAKRRWQRLRPDLTIHCFEGALDGEGPITVSGPAALVPPRFGAPGTDGGGSGRGGGGGAGDPTEPARGGGCRTVVLGTNARDELSGSGRGEVFFALGSGDRVRGRGGNDCLLGGPGGDLLKGEAGHDRLVGEGGRDVLIGGPGLNAYDAGGGRDLVRAANGRPELVRCGSGRDRALIDRLDRTRGCESVRRKT